MNSPLSSVALVERSLDYDADGVPVGASFYHIDPSPEMISILARYQSVEEVSFYVSEIEDAELCAVLSRLQALRRCYFLECRRLTDQCVSCVMDKIGLEEVYLTGVRISPDAMERLQERRPDLSIQYSQLDD